MESDEHSPWRLRLFNSHCCGGKSKRQVRPSFNTVHRVHCVGEMLFVTVWSSECASQCRMEKWFSSLECHQFASWIHYRVAETMHLHMDGKMKFVSFAEENRKALLCATKASKVRPNGFSASFSVPRTLQTFPHGKLKSSNWPNWFGEWLNVLAAVALAEIWIFLFRIRLGLRKSTCWPIVWHWRRIYSKRKIGQEFPFYKRQQCARLSRFCRAILCTINGCTDDLISFHSQKRTNEFNYSLHSAAQRTKSCYLFIHENVDLQLQRLLSAPFSLSASVDYDILFGKLVATELHVYS